jgi:EmrB/QacA subfamily drug resistance transporter
VLGPVLGGLVISSLDWRWAFLVNVPVCLAALAFSWRIVHGSPAAERPALDGLGLALLAPGLTALVYGLTEYGTTGDPFAPGTSTAVAVGALLLAGYCGHALHTPKPPILDLRLFRDRSFRACATLVFVFGGSLFGAMLLLPLYYQQVHGATPLQAGLLLAPQGIGAMLGTTVVGRVLDRTGAARATILVGLALAALGTLPFAIDPDLDELLLAGALVVRGIGLSASLVPTMTATYATLPRSEYAAATTGSRILQQVGGSLGTALLAVVLARTGAFTTAFWVTVGITAVAAVAALSLPGSARSDLPAR